MTSVTHKQGFVTWNPKSGLYCSEQLFHQVFGMPSIVLPCLERLNKLNWAIWKIQNGFENQVFPEHLQGQIDIRPWYNGLWVRIRTHNKNGEQVFEKGFCTIISYKHIAEQIWIRAHEKAEQMHYPSFNGSKTEATKFEANSLSSDRQHLVKVNKDFLSSITCSCMLFKCIQNRMFNIRKNGVPEMVPLRKAMESLPEFSGVRLGYKHTQMICHHSAKVLFLFGYYNLAAFVENKGSPAWCAS